MRLINTESFTFEEHYDPVQVEYAVLSHTWRREEVVFGDLVGVHTVAAAAAGVAIADNGTGVISPSASVRGKHGYAKLEAFCRLAHENHFKYVWLDTACIDKSSSAELSEAINSMYQWYRTSTVCYVYLDDVETAADIHLSRWIRRGWTLQELIAPAEVVFFNKRWEEVGSKSGLSRYLARWTGIDDAVLHDNHFLTECSIAARMSWAAKRATTRLEDQAYSLLGLFGVNMPLLYGEGTRAFRRLQEEILKTSQDQSILVWSDIAHNTYDYLAPSPDCFRWSQRVVECRHHDGNYTPEKVGLKVRLRVLNFPDPGSGRELLAVLDCRLRGNVLEYVRVALRKVERVAGLSEPAYYITQRWSRSVGTIPAEIAMKLEYRHVYLVRLAARDNTDPQSVPNINNSIVKLYAPCLQDHGFEISLISQTRPYLEADVTPRSDRSLTSEMMMQNGRAIREFGFVHRDHNEAFIVIFQEQIVHLTWQADRQATIVVITKPREERNAFQWLERELGRRQQEAAASQFGVASVSTGNLNICLWDGRHSEARLSVPLESARCVQHVRAVVRTARLIGSAVWMLHVDGPQANDDAGSTSRGDVIGAVNTNIVATTTNTFNKSPDNLRHQLNLDSDFDSHSDTDSESETHRFGQIVEKTKSPWRWSSFPLCLGPRYVRQLEKVAWTFGLPGNASVEEMVERWVDLNRTI